MTYGSLFSGIGCFDLAFDRAGWECLWRCEIDPHCRRVLRHHWPGAPIYEDVREIGRGSLEPVDLVVGGSPCFPAGTLVLTSSGLKPIEDVRAGDEVLTHAGRYRPVTATTGRIAPIVSIKGQGHPGLRCTPDHRFWASGGRWRKFVPAAERRRGNWYSPVYREPSWVPASQLKGRYWASPCRFPVLEIPQPIPAGRERKVVGFGTSEFFWAVGVWLGDGWITTSFRPGRSRDQTVGGVLFCAGHAQADELERRLKEVGWSPSRSNERTTARFRVTSGALTRWLEGNFGRYCHGKTIPSWAIGAPEELRRSLLEGYLWADGSGGESKRRATTVSKSLAVGMKLIAQSLGYSVSLHRFHPRRELTIEGRKVSELPQWQLVICKKARSSFVLGHHRFGLVRGVREDAAAETVYDIEVADDHSFYADGIAVHNCQDWSVAGRRAGLSGGRAPLFLELVRVAREVGARWLLFENVPGLLSQRKGRDFAFVLGQFTGHEPDPPAAGWRNSGFGWGPRGSVCWRVCDARYWGVPQRRRRVFALVRLGDFRGLDREDRDGLRSLLPLPGKVLLEPESLLGDHPPRRRAGAGVAAGAPAGAGGAGGARSGEQLTMFVDVGEGHQTYERSGVSTPLRTSSGGGGQLGTVALFQATGAGAERPGPPSLASSDDNGSNQVVVAQRHGSNVDPMGALRAGNGNEAGTVVTVRTQQTGANGSNVGEGVSPTLGAGDQPPAGLPAAGMTVRRLTPTECLRLMALPDDWLDIDPPLSDSRKYHMIGNGCVVNVAFYIADRILRAERGDL